MNLSISTFTLAVAALGIPRTESRPMAYIPGSGLPYLNSLSNELRRIVAQYSSSYTRNQLSQLNRAWRAGTRESSMEATKSLGQTFASSIQFYSVISEPDKIPILDKIIQDDVEKKAESLAHDWMTLFKHETYVYLSMRLDHNIKVRPSDNQLGELKKRLFKEVHSHGVVLVDGLEDKSLYSAFPILQVAHELTVPEFTGLLSALFGPELGSSLTLATSSTLAPKSYQPLVQHLLMAAKSDIYEVTLFHVIWHLFQKAVSALPDSGAETFNKIKEFFTTTLGPARNEIVAISNTNLTNYARFALALAARSFQPRAGHQSNEATKAAIHDMAAFFDKLVGWDSVAEESLVSVQQYRTAYLTCLDTKEVMGARDYLLEYWPQLDQINQGISNEPRSSPIAPFVEAVDDGLDDAYCDEILFSESRVFWSNEGFGMAAAKDFLDQKYLSQYRFG
ncbi:hypothetical protein H4R33_006898 [Dimargaris cristalligena]|uniref:Uncharacterized protein n=1 Tax=Dimargaris cristalligena TaxID=215637 RepID=A0A4P9ZM74_9FUNG|nr:hypothetical protein H4R33_006898 [Dimargaris cristalligena]RKP33621.1 hypothetical protein BJ085DRAFT_32189 [Dimargaris cristalligena]|eukprot:RKP33621.1 hypothetical protein BJ085DRAFT_32189 [Dimargaris cristalligena]